MISNNATNILLYVGGLGAENIKGPAVTFWRGVLCAFQTLNAEVCVRATGDSEILLWPEAQTPFYTRKKSKFLGGLWSNFFEKQRSLNKLQACKEETVPPHLSGLNRLFWSVSLLNDPARRVATTMLPFDAVLALVVGNHRAVHDVSLDNANRLFGKVRSHIVVFPADKGRVTGGLNRENVEICHRLAQNIGGKCTEVADDIVKGHMFDRGVIVGTSILGHSCLGASHCRL